MEKEYKNIEDSLLIKFILGEVSEAEKQQVESWIASDIKNAQYYSRVEEIVVEQKNYSFYQDIDVDNKWEELQQLKGRRRSKKIYLNILKIAASIVILFSIGFLVKDAINTKSSKQILYVAETNNDVLMLPDSSSIILQKGAEVSYAKEFDREIAFEGNGFFNIKKDVNNPFIVKVADNEIKILGTSFDVLSEDTIRVSLYSGKISYTNQASVDTLMPGQQIIETNTGNTEIIDFRSSQENLKFNAMPLSEACSKMEKVHLYKFSIEKELEHLKITGDFSGSSIHEFLNSLSFLFDVETSVRERYIVVSKLKS